jgi:class I fructose-bisphosphate aldolase
MLDKAGETALDICAYAAHMAALMGAHIIKVKPPTDHLSLPAAVKVYEDEKIPRATMAERVRHIVQTCFAGRRILLLSGGENNKDTADLLHTIQGIRDGGANGAIIGRNTFQRPREEALEMLAKIIDIYAKPATA